MTQVSVRGGMVSGVWDFRQKCLTQVGVGCGRGWMSRSIEKYTNASPHKGSQMHSTGFGLESKVWALSISHVEGFGQ